MQDFKWFDVKIPVGDSYPATITALRNLLREINDHYLKSSNGYTREQAELIEEGLADVDGGEPDSPGMNLAWLADALDDYSPPFHFFDEQDGEWGFWPDDGEDDPDRENGEGDDDGED